MKIHFKKLLFAGIFAVFSCDTKENLPIVDEQVIEKSPFEDHDLERFLRDYGFNLSDVSEFPDFYLIENDISVDKETLRNGGYLIKSDPNAQARTTSIVNSTPWNIRTIRVKIDSSMPTSGDDNWRPEIVQALGDLNSISNFRLHFELVVSGSYDILIRSGSGLPDTTLARAEWPAGGNPGYQIQVNLNFLEDEWNISGGYVSESAAKRRTMVHEIGHCIGYRHTNHPVAYYGGPEGSGSMGLHEIPGTWTNDPGSVMNAGTPFENWNGFSVLDILANRAVYPIDPGESPLFTYVKNVTSTIKSHNWSGEWSEFGLNFNGYNYRGFTGFIYLYQKANTVPLYRYAHSTNTYYLTTDPNLTNSDPAFTLDKTVGYVYTSSGANRVPVYEYYNNNEGHFFTTNYGDAWTSGPGWVGGGIAFYVEKIM